MTPCESHTALNGSPSVGADYPQLCVHELFERQVERDPGATAVVCGGRQLTYGELNGRANQVAHRLRRLGVGPDTLVAVCLKRSLEMAIGLLGVWKAGGAYVPLDPIYPAERLAFMCRDAGARILLTDEHCQHLLASLVETSLCLDSGWPLLAGEPAGNLPAIATPAHLAYVMYTSGSTGRPKGAMIPHRGLANYLWWAKSAYGVEPGGTVPVHSSISFDLTVTSLYTPLVAGAQVELLPEEAGGEHLLKALRSSRCRSLIKITPAHLDLLNQLLRPEEMAQVTKVFVIGGEALRGETLRVWRQFAPDARLINEYGPTETVVGCCVYEVQPDDPSSGAVPIGRPIANTQLYVLDAHMQPVKPGIVGELYIGGAGVGRGYWNQPRLTQEAFVPDRFSADPAARLYKTGDLVRQRHDGLLEFLGRADNQVKIHGFRIELGDIEAALAGHRAVHSCAMIARENASGDKQLVGYLVADGQRRPTPEELRSFLESKLPHYMVPARFVFLETLPLTENGKVDRRALPESDAVETASGAPFVAPQTEIEKTLATLWSELLHVKRIGIHDDFFALGGHSLLAIKAVARIQDALQLGRSRLPLATFLQTPTIAGLAKVLAKKDWTPSWASLVPMHPDGSQPPLFLFHARGGNVLEYQLLVRRLRSDRPVYGFQALGLNGEIVRGATVESMAAAHLAELRQVQPKGPYFLGGFCFGGLLALEAAQQLTQAGQEVSLLVLIESLRPGGLRFTPDATWLQRWRYRAATRLEVERWKAQRLNGQYFRQSLRDVWDFACARTAIAWDRAIGARRDPARLSTRYIFRALCYEHQAAAARYAPRPYAGKARLFLASEHVHGPLANEAWWRDVLCGPVQISELRGNHHQMLFEPAVSELANQLNEDFGVLERPRSRRRRSVA